MYKRLTKDIFIQRANSVHNNKYDYSKVEYKNGTTKVCIICPEHGEFWQIPKSHLRGQGCPICANHFKGTTNRFIERAKQVHGDKYDYSKSNYVNNKTKLCIICTEHGEFWQLPNTHIYGSGCPHCGNRLKLTAKTFAIKANKIHFNKYDYSNVKYIDSKTKVCIICPEHGEFSQTPSDHLCGKGCPKCGIFSRRQKQSMDLDEFISKARDIHSNKYFYSKVKYINMQTKVCIICPEHGEFLQRPTDHINNKCGCPMCKTSHMENEIRNLLMSNNIKFEEQKRFEWLGKLSLDFYLPKYNAAIECQGKQHFVSVKYFGGDIGFTKRIVYDEKKKNLCKQNHIDILYYADYNDINFPYNIFTNKDKLLDAINNLTP